jgi:uncharacterized protein YkwD
MNRLQRLIKNLVLGISIILAQQTLAAAPTHPKAITDAEYQTSILYYVNAYRIKHHLAPLKMSNLISQEAAKHSLDMASHSMPFGHNDFDGRIKRLYQQLKECRGGAENVAYYKLDAKRLVEQWIASPGHRRNIEGNYNLTGIGIAHSKKGWAYYTQIFLRSDGSKVG